MTSSTIHQTILFFLSPLLAASLLGQSWQPLFNGRDLSGWETRNGSAEYRVEDGSIVGESLLDTPNTFLCTERAFGDFILEFEVWLDPRLNSGVQIRSLSDPAYRGGRVHGYQVELDPSARAWSGGIYDESRRGWLYPLTRNEDSRRAFRVAQWNHVRVEAVGDSIRTWVNGVMCANLADDLTAEGFIGLQVHSVQREEDAGLQVKWKNLRIMTGALESARWQPDPEVPEVSWLKNRLTETERRRGWRLLWDGATSEGWRRANDVVFPERGWEMADGLLTVIETGGGEARAGGDIVTEQEFSSFELELDFMIEAGANSGIKYLVVEGLNKGPGSAIGPEYQILDDALHPDAKKGTGGNRTIGSLYDLIPAENLSEADRARKRVNRPGQWNKARLVVRGARVEHWLNNVKVVEYERGSPIYRALVANSKYDKFDGFGEASSGHILLQDHGNRVSFRSIKAREL